MKILYLSARFPFPPYRGDRLTGFHLLRTFSLRHDVTLLSFVDGSEPAEARGAVAQVCARIETVHLSRRRSWMQAWLGLPARAPSQVSFYRSAEMARAVNGEIERGGYDVVFTQLIRMSPYASELGRTPRVLFLGDSLALALKRSQAFAPAWKRPGMLWERRRLGRFEAAMTERFDETWVLSDVDRNDLVDRGAVRVVSLPHGVDERLFEIPLTARVSRQVFFLGNLSVPHNVDAARHLARDIWPGIAGAVPGSRLIIGGADPIPEVRALGRIDGVTIPGPIPDLLDTWRTVSVLVAPLRFSTGIQNKVIEAMAAGVPVVTTPAVAASIHAGEETLLVGEDAGSIRTAAIGVLESPERYADMVRRAREFVRERFSWDLLGRRLERVAGVPSSTSELVNA